MKKLWILALSAIFVANVSAQEVKKEGCKGKQLSKEERVDFDIKRLKHELMLSDEQAAKFEVTYREYAGKLDELFQKRAPKEDFQPGKELTDKDLDKFAKDRLEGQKDFAELQLKFYDKFRKDLSARQVEKVLRLNEPFGPKPCCGKPDGKQCDKKCDKKCDKHEGHHGQHGHPHGAPQDFPKKVISGADNKTTFIRVSSFFALWKQE